MSIPSDRRSVSSILNNLIGRVRVLEALPEPASSAEIVSAYWTGSRSSGNAVASPTANIGDPLELNTGFYTNSLETFGTGVSTDSADPPTNDPSDVYALILKPGVYVWTAEFQAVNPTASAPPYPDNTSPWVDFNIEEAFMEMWALPNQSGFPNDWDKTNVNAPQPPVFTTGGGSFSTVSWSNKLFMRFSSHGILSSSTLAFEWGFFQLFLVNQSGSDVGISYKLSVSGVTLPSVAAVENVY